MSYERVIETKLCQPKNETLLLFAVNIVNKKASSNSELISHEQLCHVTRQLSLAIFAFKKQSIIKRCYHRNIFSLAWIRIKLPSHNCLIKGLIPKQFKQCWQKLSRLICNDVSLLGSWFHSERGSHQDYLSPHLDLLLCHHLLWLIHLVLSWTSQVVLQERKCAT